MAVGRGNQRGHWAAKSLESGSSMSRSAVPVAMNPGQGENPPHKLEGTQA